MIPANSCYMDAACAGGGPATTCLPQIASGEPRQILAYTAQLIDRIRRLESLVHQLQQHRDQLRQHWQGPASEAASHKLAKSFEAIYGIIRTVYAAVRELEAAAAQVGVAQQGYNSVVGSVNPTVGSLMSNFYTYGAGVALANSTTAALQAFLKGVGASMEQIGYVKLGQEIIAIAEIAQAAEQLYNSLNGGPSYTSPYGSGVGSNGVVNAPPPMTSVASTSGQTALGYAPAGGFPTTGYPTAATYPPAAAPGTYSPPNPNSQMFIPIDPTTGAPVGQPVAAPVATAPPAAAPPAAAPPGDHGVDVTAEKDGLKITVHVPTDAGALDINVSATDSAGDKVSEHVEVSADGKVNVV